MSDGAHPAEGTSVRRHNASVLASPVARRLAREHGIEIASVRGSGPDGRIERRDVEALIGATTAVAEPVQAPPVVASTGLPRDSSCGDGQPPARMRDRDVPRHRQVIAQRLTRSVQMIPQIALMATVDMTRARALARRAARRRSRRSDVHAPHPARGGAGAAGASEHQYALARRGSMATRIAAGRCRAGHRRGRYAAGRHHR